MPRLSAATFGQAFDRAARRLMLARTRRPENPCAFAKRPGMKNEAIIDGITVGGQPSAEDLANGRFGSVINIREDHEPGNNTAGLVAGTDIAYTSVPWTIDSVTPGDIARIRTAVDAAEGPVLIHCMGATRAAVAAAIVSAEKDGSGAAGALGKVADAGFEIEGTPYAAFIDTLFSSNREREGTAPF
jgi:uncharacterized protein (TIGR01244 family)